MTINYVTRTPGAKYFVTLLKRKIEKCIETQCFSSKGRVVASKRSSG